MGQINTSAPSTDATTLLYNVVECFSMQLFPNNIEKSLMTIREQDMKRVSEPGPAIYHEITRRMHMR